MFLFKLELESRFPDTRAGDKNQTNSPRKKHYSPVWYNTQNRCEMGRWSRAMEHYEKV